MASSQSRLDHHQSIENRSNRRTEVKRPGLHRVPSKSVDRFGWSSPIFSQHSPQRHRFGMVNPTDCDRPGYRVKNRDPRSKHRSDRWVIGMHRHFDSETDWSLDRAAARAELVPSQLHRRGPWWMLARRMFGSSQRPPSPTNHPTRLLEPPVNRFGRSWRSHRGATPTQPADAVP